MQTVSWAGSTYNIPNQRGDTPWSGLSDFAIAVAAKGINTGGGNFTLLADINFGATFGLVSTYFKSRTANIASAGQVRLANADTIKFRNTLNNGDLSVAIASNRLTFEGSRLIIAGAAEIVNADVAVGAAIVYSKLALTGSIVNADVSASAAIAYTKLTLTGAVVNADIAAAAAIAYSKLAALTFSRALVSDGAGVVTVATTTAAEIGFVNGVTSAIQTQLNAKAATDLSNVASVSANVPMNSKKFTGLANGSASGDSVNFGQYQQAVPNILDNGGFEIWQRGTSFSNPASAAYVADRWKVSTNEAATVTVTKEVSTIDTGLASMKVVTSATGASKTWLIFQPLENYAEFRGRTITFSARVKTSVASAVKIAIDDGVLAPVVSSYHTGGGAFETLTVTTTVSAANPQLYLYIGMINAGDKKDGTYFFDSAMLALGSETVTFTPTNMQVDTARCQRFYQRFGSRGASEYIAAGQCTSTTAAQAMIQFPVLMRTTPTVTVTAATTFAVTNSSGATTATTVVTVNTPLPQSVLMLLTVASGLTAGNATNFFSNNSGSYIEASADI